MADPPITAAFYDTALLGLVALEHHDPTTRRFGPEADSAWSMWSGHLDDADRIDLLIRDAAVSHPAAFAPRTVFGFDELPDDEPFGATWFSTYGRDTGRRALQNTIAALGTPPDELWRRALAAWGLEPGPTDGSPVDASTRILAIGSGAVAALAPRFFVDSNLDWGRQVTAVADTAAGIQLAGLVPLCAGTKTAARTLRPEHARHTRDFDQLLVAHQPTDEEAAFAATLRAR